MSGNVVGVDLSLTATGLAIQFTDGTIHRTISAPKLAGMERLDCLAEQIDGKIALGDLVIFEDLAFSMNNAYAKENAGLAYLIRWRLWKRGIPYLLVTASSLKKFVTGAGNAEKSLLLREVYKRWGVDAANDNEADAVGLLYIGLAYTGQWEPTTEAQREVLEVLRNPKTKKRKPATARREG